MSLIFISYSPTNIVCKTQNNSQSKKDEVNTIKKELWFENTIINDPEIKKTTIFIQVNGNKVYGETNYVETDIKETYLITPQGILNGSIKDGKYIDVKEQITNRDGSVILKEQV